MFGLQLGSDLTLHGSSWIDSRDDQAQKMTVQVTIFDAKGPQSSCGCGAESFTKLWPS